MVFVQFFALMEGSGARAKQINYESGCGSRGLKNIQIQMWIQEAQKHVRILWIRMRIRNPAWIGIYLG
jgi:hypothetical protein